MAYAANVLRGMAFTTIDVACDVRRVRFDDDSLCRVDLRFNSFLIGDDFGVERSGDEWASDNVVLDVDEDGGDGAQSVATRALGADPEATDAEAGDVDAVGAGPRDKEHNACAILCKSAVKDMHVKSASMLSTSNSDFCWRNCNAAACCADDMVLNCAWISRRRLLFLLSSLIVCLTSGHSCCHKQAFWFALWPVLPQRPHVTFRFLSPLPFCDDVVLRLTRGFAHCEN